MKKQEFELNKEIADKVMQTKGEVRGVTLKTDEKFILNKGGEKKIKEVEQEMRSLGYSISYAGINTMEFYPVGLRVLSMLAIAKVFEMKKEQVEEMGSFAPKVSLIIKFFLQYFISPRKNINQVSRMWQKHYTVGKVTPVEIDEKNKKVIVKLENFEPHPIFCSYLKGYFLKITEIIIKSSAQCQETECSFDKGKNHTFLIKW
jgi:hypothetical protein